MEVTKNLDILEERILWEAVEKKLRLDGVDETNINNHRRVTISGHSKKEDSESSTDYIKTVININNHPIEVYTNKHFRKGYLHYYHYHSDGKFDNGNKYTFDIYLPVNNVLDGDIFYTTTKEERRNLKIKKLIKKIIV